MQAPPPSALDLLLYGAPMQAPLGLAAPVVGALPLDCFWMAV